MRTLIESYRRSPLHVPRRDFAESWRFARETLAIRSRPAYPGRCTVGKFNQKEVLDRAADPSTPAETRQDVDSVSKLAMIAVVAAAVVAVLLNVVLLNSTSSGNDPVGKLGPIARLPARGLRPAPPGVVQPSTGPVRGEGKDD
jgi:hypothetical protein